MTDGSDDDDEECDSGESDLTVSHLRAMAEYIKRETKARTVQIHITRDHEGGGCERYAQGVGNIYERIGAITEWIKTV